MRCDDLTFSKVVKEIYKIYDDIIILAKIDNEIKVISPISKDIVALVPYTDDIEICSKNIEIIKLSPQNAKIAKESATVATKAKEITIAKAQEALGSANSAHLSALFAGAKEESIEKISSNIDNKKIEIFGKIDKHNKFINLSKKEIDAIKKVLLQSSLEAQTARDEAVSSAVVATAVKETVKSRANFVASVVPVVSRKRDEAVRAEANSKKYRDKVLALSIDFKTKSSTVLNESRKYRDETKVLYEALKDVDRVYDIKKEIYTLRTGTIYETRGEVTR